MVIKKIFGKLRSFRKTEKKVKVQKKKKTKSKPKKISSEYKNRFHKFYHLHKKRLNKERRGLYKNRSKKGICVRCKKKVVRDIVFCKYHKAKQKEYNAKARKKKK
tara:strand:- start:69 stop:383 length:315 start_codon:yes stop_codon:yes gene_type:complete